MSQNIYIHVLNGLKPKGTVCSTSVRWSLWVQFPPRSIRLRLDGVSSLTSGISIEAWNDSLFSHEVEGEPTIIPAKILKFLKDTFQKKRVKVKDFFPDLKIFITSAKYLVAKSREPGVGEQEMHHLKKHILKAKEELQVHQSFAT